MDILLALTTQVTSHISCLTYEKVNHVNLVFFHGPGSLILIL